MQRYIKRQLERRSFSVAFWAVIISVILLIGMLVFFYLLTGSKNPLHLNVPYDIAKTGQLGDSINGILAPVIAFLAVVLTFLAFYIQYEANNMQKVALQEQNKQQLKQQFESRFFELLSIQRANVAETVMKESKDQEKTGRRAFVQMRDELRDVLLVRVRNAAAEHKVTLDARDIANISYLLLFFGVGGDASEIVAKFINAEYANLPKRFIHDVLKTPYHGNQSRLGHYFRHLYQTVKFVDDQPESLLTRKEKYFYIKTLRAQLSTHELVIFFYNSLSALGQAWRDENLVNKYHFIKNLPRDFALGIDPKQYYPRINFELENFFEGNRKISVNSYAIPTGTTHEIKLEKIIHNCHTHLFTLDHVPDNFFGVMPVHALRKKLVRPFGRILVFIVRMLMGKSAAKKYKAFLGIADKRDQEEVFSYLKGFYPEETRFVVLSMDFEYMERGEPKKSFIEQLDELAALKQKYPDQVFPFICVDPRRECVLDLVKKYIEKHNFAGIKLYPSLGYFPTDCRLDPVYEYAMANNIPIVTHCIPINSVFYKGDITNELVETASRNLQLDPENISRRKKEFGRYFNHPGNFIPVLEKYGDLKINFGHFGGDEEWNRYLDESWENGAGKLVDKTWFAIIRDDLIKKHKNVYSDISFTVYDCSLYPLLKNLLQDEKVRDKVLFGTDFFMLEKDYTERRFSIDVRGYLDEDDYWQIAEVNPKVYLS